MIEIEKKIIEVSGASWFNEKWMSRLVGKKRGCTFLLRKFNLKFEKLAKYGITIKKICCNI